MEVSIRPRAVAALGLLATALVAAVGCTTTGQARAEKSVLGMNEMRAAASEIKQNSSVAVASLDVLIRGTGGDAKIGFEKYKKDVEAAEESVARLESRMEAVRSETRKYFDEWQARLGEIGNEEMRKHSLDRRTEQMKAIEGLEKTMAETRTGFAPLLSNLRDACRYLANDLSTGGLQALKKVANQLAKENASSDRAIDRLIVKIDEVAPTFRAESPAH